MADGQGGQGHPDRVHTGGTQEMFRYPGKWIRAQCKRALIQQIHFGSKTKESQKELVELGLTMWNARDLERKIEPQVGKLPREQEEPWRRKSPRGKPRDLWRCPVFHGIEETVCGDRTMRRRKEVCERSQEKKRQSEALVGLRQGPFSQGEAHLSAEHQNSAWRSRGLFPHRHV